MSVLVNEELCACSQIVGNIVGLLYYELLFTCLIVAMCFFYIWQVVELDWPKSGWIWSPCGKNTNIR